MTRPGAVIGGLALAGCYFHFAPEVRRYPDGTSSTTTSSLSGCETSIATAAGRNLADGGIFIDKSGVDESTLVRWVCSGPMDRTALPPWDYDHWGNCGTVDPSSVPGPSDPAWSAMPDDRPAWLRSTAYVGIALYVAIWRSLGARIGVRRGGVIAWEDGRETALEGAP